MKSLEDLRLMSAPMLEGIHLQLTGSKPKKGMSKADLVQRVYDLQQPDPTPPEEEKRDEKATEGADKAPEKDEFDDLTGDGVDDDAEKPQKSAADELSVEGEEEPEDDLIGEVDGPKLPAKVEFDHTNDQADPKDIVRALAHTGLNVVVDEDVVNLRKGGQTICTTVKQPLHRIVATAETFAKR